MSDGRIGASSEAAGAMPNAARDWDSLVELIEQVMADEALLPQVVAGVRSTVREVAVLPVSDMAAHTRALFTAATRALAARRAPTEAELGFVEELAVARAAQGISIEVVLGAIHVAERAIWSRARVLAAAAGIGPDLLLDARDLYDDWAELVRGRLIQAHRDAAQSSAGALLDRHAQLMERLLEGGSASLMAAAEVGLPTSGGLYVLVCDASDQDAVGLVSRLTAGHPAVLRVPLGQALVAVTGRRPGGRSPRPSLGPLRGDGALVAWAGPVPTDGVGPAHRMAAAAAVAAREVGVSGAVHATDVSAVAAVLTRDDLTDALVVRHRAARNALGSSALPVARAVRAWVENDRDTGAASEELFVHANTVRNRVHRFVEVTGIDPGTSFGALDAWWLCRAWLGDSDRPQR